MSETKRTPVDPFDFLYDSREDAKTAFRDHWCGPEKFEHGKDTLVAKYDKHPEDGDGQAVEVYCCAMPARFYRLRILAGPNSIGEVRPGFSVGTGSGQERLAAAIAKAISEGMLGFYPEAVEP